MFCGRWPRGEVTGVRGEDGGLDIVGDVLVVAMLEENPLSFRDIIGKLLGFGSLKLV